MMHHDITFNGVLVERVIDNGDGTGEHLIFDTDGVTVLATEPVTGLPVSPEPDPTEEAIAVLAEIVESHGADALRQVVALALTVTSNVEALEQAVIDEDPLAGVVVVKDAAVAANEIAASLGQEETPE
jgi:hypothetical protein